MLKQIMTGLEITRNLTVFTILTTYSIASGAIYNVKDYGAVGNGTTDDTSAIQAAIDAAASAGGTNVVYFPSNGVTSAATYLTGTLTPKTNVWMEGSGRLSTLKLKDNVNAPVIGVNYSTTLGVNNVRIRSLTIDGNKANNTGSPSALSACAIFFGGHDIIVEGNYIFNSRQAGIVLGVEADVTDQSNNQILNNWVHNPGLDNEGWGGIALIHGSGATIRGNTITTNDNYMHWAINVEPNSTQTVSGVTIANNLSRGGSIMVQGPGSVHGATVKDNDVDASNAAGGGPGIRVHDTTGTVLISNNAVTTNQHNVGIELLNLSDPTVTTNLIGNIGSNQAGVRLEDVSGGTMSYNRISSPSGTSSTIGFVHIGTTSGITYTGNEYYNIASVGNPEPGSIGLIGAGSLLFIRRTKR